MCCTGCTYCDFQELFRNIVLLAKPYNFNLMVVDDSKSFMSEHSYNIPVNTIPADKQTTYTHFKINS